MRAHGQEANARFQYSWRMPPKPRSDGRGLAGQNRGKAFYTMENICVEVWRFRRAWRTIETEYLC